MPLAWVERPDGVRRGRPQCALARSERDDGLHQALAENARANERRLLVVLQRAGDDLRGRRRADIDQHDERLAHCKIPPAGVEALGILGIAARHGDNLALIQECTRYRDRLIDQTPGIVTQIDDEAFELTPKPALRQVDRVAQCATL
jgi:hypothetical protein